MLRRALLGISALITCGIAASSAGASACEPFNTWVSGYGQVTAISSRQIAIRWEIASDGALLIGRHRVRLVAGCHYRQLTGVDITPSTPAQITMRINRKTPFVGDARPRVGQIVTFTTWRARTPLPEDIARSQVRVIGVMHGATTSVDAMTG